MALTAHYAGERELAHLAGSNPAVWEFESPHPHSMPGRLTRQATWFWATAVKVRILARQQCRHTRLVTLPP